MLLQIVQHMLLGSMQVKLLSPTLKLFVHICK